MSDKALVEYEKMSQADFVRCYDVVRNFWPNSISLSGRHYYKNGDMHLPHLMHLDELIERVLYDGHLSDQESDYCILINAAIYRMVWRACYDKKNSLVIKLDFINNESVENHIRERDREYNPGEATLADW